MSDVGWIGVDLDGTLAVYKSRREGGCGIAGIGEPIQPMLERVKRWLVEGKTVRIVTARVSGLFSHIGSAWPGTEAGKADYREATEQQVMIHEWCLEHIGQALVVTAVKDFSMIELWDDRAVSVEKNTGRCLSSHIFEDVE